MSKRTREEIKASLSLVWLLEILKAERQLAQVKQVERSLPYTPEGVR